MYSYVCMYKLIYKVNYELLTNVYIELSIKAKSVSEFMFISSNI